MLFSNTRTISEVVAQALEEYAAAEDTIQNSALNFVHDTLKVYIIRGYIVMKSGWNLLFEVQEFAANEYVAACGDSGKVINLSAMLDNTVIIIMFIIT